MANKKIVYTAVSTGIDGRDKPSVVYASYDEKELKALNKRDKNGAWFDLSEQIVDVDKAKKQALAKLNGIDRLVLGLPSWVDDK